MGLNVLATVEAFNRTCGHVSEGFYSSRLVEICIYKVKLFKYGRHTIYGMSKGVEANSRLREMIDIMGLNVLATAEMFSPESTGNELLITPESQEATARAEDIANREIHARKTMLMHEVKWQANTTITTTVAKTKEVT